MPDAQSFKLTEARPNLILALKKANYDVMDEPDEPNLLHARRDTPTGSSYLFIDGGGRLRFSLTRQTAPEQAFQHHTSDGQVLDVTRESNETLTVSCQLNPNQTVDFAHFLAELGKI